MTPQPSDSAATPLPVVEIPDVAEVCRRLRALVGQAVIDEWSPEMIGAAAVVLSRFLPASPFNKDRHGLHCWFRTGGPCDCTAKTDIYYRMVPLSREVPS